MPPALALLVWAIFGLVLLRWSKDPKESPALWVPVIWLLIISSRLPSQWLGLTPMTTATAFEEGSSLDRIIYLGLIILALCILGRRKLNWTQLFARNSVLLLFLLFALASVTWSDFPYVSLKRWVRDLGLYVAVLVVLSDPRPVMAMSAVIRRFSCILLFLSLTLIKYYPEIGVAYDPWSGAPEYQGATTSKNMLGVVCLVSGLFYFWDTLRRWPERKAPKAWRVLFANVILTAITVRLLLLSNSATSRACLIMGCLIIAIVRSGWAQTNPRRITASIPLVLAGYAVLEYVFDLSSMIAHLLGRDATLHGRTGIWDALLNLQRHPLLGVGYQTFWMGDRLTAIWSSLGVAFLNEAHNGYLEIYLSLGLVGVTLIVMFMISSYRRVCRQLTVSSEFASFGIALWMVTVFYNFTEAAFGATLLWCALLLCVIVVPRADEVAAMGKRETAKALHYYAHGHAKRGMSPLRPGEKSIQPH